MNMKWNAVYEYRTFTTFKNLYDVIYNDSEWRKMYNQAKLDITKLNEKTLEIVRRYSNRVQVKIVNTSAQIGFAGSEKYEIQLFVQ